MASKVLRSELCQYGFVDAPNDQTTAITLKTDVQISILCISKLKLCNRPAVVHYWEYCKQPIWGRPYFDPWLFCCCCYFGGPFQTLRAHLKKKIETQQFPEASESMFLLLSPSLDIQTLRHVSQDSQFTELIFFRALQRQKTHLMLSSPLKKITV